MHKIEEKNKIEEFLKETIKLKTKEREKLEQDVKKLKAENKVLDSSNLLEELINTQKANLDKTGVGFYSRVRIKIKMEKIKAKR